MGAFFESTPTIWNAVRWLVGAPRPIEGDEPERGSQAPLWIAGACVAASALLILGGLDALRYVPGLDSSFGMPLFVGLSFFLHASVFHLAGNLAFMDALWDEVENTLGVTRTLALLVVAHLSSFAVEYVAYEFEFFAVGASGGLSGLFVAYALLHPDRELEIPTGFLIVPALRGVFWIPVRAPWFLGIWTALQAVLFALQVPGVSAAGHLGGAIAGLALALMWRRGV